MCVKWSIHHKSINPDCSAIAGECPILPQSTGLGIRFWECVFLAILTGSAQSFDNLWKNGQSDCNPQSTLTLRPTARFEPEHQGRLPDAIECTPQSCQTITIAKMAPYGSLQSWRNRGSRFLQSTVLWLNCGKFTILLQFRPIELKYFKIVGNDTWHWHRGFLR